MAAKHPSLQSWWLIILSQVTWWVADRPNKQTQFELFLSLHTFIRCVRYWQAKHFFPGIQRLFPTSLSAGRRNMRHRWRQRHRSLTLRTRPSECFLLFHLLKFHSFSTLLKFYSCDYNTLLWSCNVKICLLLTTCSLAYDGCLVYLAFDWSFGCACPQELTLCVHKI